MALPELPLRDDMKHWLRDWWRGWSDEDLASVLTKIQIHVINPGAIIPVTERELLAHKAYVSDRYPLRYVDAGYL